METDIRTVVMFSSGISSWAAGKRYAEDHGTEGMVLLFADTLIEDEDNYRFLEQSAENIGAPLITLKDGRTPGQVMKDERIIGNSRIDPCSKILKRKLLDQWRDANCDPEKTTIILGIGWDEEHRIIRVQERTAPWNYIAPLCDAPYLTKRDQLAWAAREGIKPPRMYDMGFPHANCGGFCIKAGHATFKMLLQHFPDRYLEWEQWEQEMRDELGDHSILSDRSGDGKKKVLTLQMLRERIEAEVPIDEFDFGGCACALPID